MPNSYDEAIRLAELETAMNSMKKSIGEAIKDYGRSSS